jgi:nicotinamide mononucleotide transporter
VNAVEWAAAVFGLVSVYLTVRQNPWCWPLGIVNVLLFAWLFWHERLYADAGLQIVYLVLSLYGWWAWVRGGPGHGALPVSRTPGRIAALFLLGGTVAAAALGAALRQATNADLPFWDAGTTAGSLVAQWMQARKWLENWVVWIVVDVVYVGMYVVKGLWPTAGLYAIFIALAVLGHREWTASLRGRQALA